MKVVTALPRISQIGSTKISGTTSSAASDGFMLLDMALALTVLLLLFAIIWPTFGRGTSSLRQSAIALDIANVLRSDRTSAGIVGRPISTRIDLNQRMVLGANGHRVDVADDIALEVETGRDCATAARQYVIVFSPDGSSCGGVIVLRKGRLAYAVRFNWLSGMIEVVHSL
jgi:general secretion pathway protein H